MFIAKLSVGIGDSGIAYNSGKELGTDKNRGAVLEDGKVVRGLGTHFASLEAKQRFDKLTAESTGIRDKFNRRFLRMAIDSVFVISRRGEAKEYAASIVVSDPAITVGVMEFEIGNAGDELGEKEMKEWSSRVKEQLKRIPLGRSDEVDADGLEALATLATCPVLAKATAEKILRLVNEAKLGRVGRSDLKRGIALLDVEMDQSTLLAPRGRPELVP